MKVDKNLLIKVQYTLNTLESDGTATLVEQTTPEQPLVYIHGMGLMLPEFERNLLGLAAGEEFSFTLTPDEAYGEHQDEYITTLPRDIFFVDGEFDSEVVYEGAEVPMMTADGQQLVGLVLKVADEGITVDFNERLAGKTLHFSGSIQEVSVPTPDETQALLGGGGCGCGGGCSCGEDEGSSCGGGCSCGC